MNIVYLHSHDTGRYGQPYGYAVPTPNLQRLAQQGMLFRQAPHSSRMMGLAQRGFRLNDYQQHITGLLIAIRPSCSSQRGRSGSLSARRSGLILRVAA